MAAALKLTLAIAGIALSFSSLGCQSPAGESLGKTARSPIEISGQSETVTWTCVGTPCPWGNSTSGQAIVWPESADPVNSRLGYAVSAGAYLPETSARGLTISLEAGIAGAFAGLVDAPSHRMLGTIAPGQPLTLTGLAAGEVVSVQSDSVFSYSTAQTDPASGSDPGGQPQQPADAGSGGGPGNPDDPAGAPDAGAPAPSGTEPSVSSRVTWTCVGSPCPWGPTDSGDALVWPAAMQAIASRLGYTVSAAIYLPADAANGVTISIVSGGVGLYAGLPDDSSHRLLATVSAGQSYTIAGLAAGEVVSVQSQSSFGYTLAAGGAAGPSDAGAAAADAGPAGPPPDSGSSGGDPPAPSATTSEAVIWTCTGSPCPWGPSDSGQALVWPVSAQALSVRLGYAVSAGIYLPAASANGVMITMVTGSAGVFAGLPDAASHRLLTTIASGQAYTVTGLASGEVISVQSGAPFTYALGAGDPGGGGDPGTGGAGGGGDPGTGGAGGGGDPTPPADAINAVAARWRCNVPECTSADWTGAVIPWPAWAAYSTNARAGDSSRTVYSTAGELLYPYMGPWAEGCEVTAESGVVLIIEWQRGTDVWRGTYLRPRETYVIHLTAPEDGALIETQDGLSDFSVSLKHCDPQPLP